MSIRLADQSNERVVRVNNEQVVARKGGAWLGNAVMMTAVMTSTGCATSTTPDPKNYWSADRASQILERTKTVELAPNLAHLAPGERVAVEKLLEVGAIFHHLYEQSLHKDAVQSKTLLERAELEPAHRARLLDMYRLFRGPIATTLENAREPFLPVEPAPPGKNVYPWGVEKKDVDAFLESQPADRASVLHLRGVVRRATTENLKADQKTLKEHPVLETLHHGLSARLAGITADEKAFYGVPYSVAYAKDVLRASALLQEAATAVDGDDPEFAGYLRNRSRDLLTDDYESGDAAWVTGRFKNLNAQIGAYEVYDDKLYGVKAFWSLSLLVRDVAATEKMRAQISDLQGLENALPYEHHKTVRSDIPVGVYEVVADFGQARTANTATILPNESYLARRYGRTILLRANVMRHPELFARTNKVWKAAVVEEHHDDLVASANFERTLWHEVGHYLGVDRTADGRTLDEALQKDSSLFEEMKADLVSLFVAKHLQARGYHDDAGLKAVYASGIRRTLQTNKPRREQPYQTMQLMQMNYFVENGVLAVTQDGLTIDYGRYHDTVTNLLREVLAIQRAGDKKAGEAFIERWARWDDELHGKLAEKLRAASKYRFVKVKYGAIDG